MADIVLNRVVQVPASLFTSLISIQDRPRTATFREPTRQSSIHYHNPFVTQKIQLSRSIHIRQLPSRYQASQECVHAAAYKIAHTPAVSRSTISESHLSSKDNITSACYLQGVNRYKSITGPINKDKT
jgi:hypothetical protein